MALFGKKKEPEERFPPKESTTPVSTVVQMRQQGLSDNQIVQSLQKEGYTTTQVFEAMSQADLQPATEQPYPGMPPEQAGYPAPPQQVPPQQPVQQPLPPQPAMAPESAPAGREQMEEIAETIIDEKWEELMKGVNKIIEWKDSAEERLTKIEDDLENLKNRFSELHTGVLGRISEYDKGIRDVGTDIKAMQEVFKKALPKFTENVAALEKLAKKGKK